ncbi:MAG: bifunctional riboflavin kinase/FAD synthetase [Verrucomicrobia bacterium]|nr:bifunctional riboflavin kinase/FAD synthetase [Verrucomicrobiota bacterium]
MNIVRTAAQLNPGRRPVCLAIGFFDGVHVGHQQILRTTTTAAAPAALSAVVTFDRHPLSLVAPDRAPPLVYSLPQKWRALSSLGLDAALLLEFNTALSRQTGEEFIRNLARDVGPIQSICVGSDFHFGRQRSGNVALLRRLGRELHFAVHDLPAVCLDGQPVRSTRIRQAIASGRLQAVSRMLGRPYALAGTVVRGDRIGHTLGFPTANLDTPGLAVPPHGVYVAHARAAELTRPALVAIGLRPTLAQPQPQRRVEAHLLDFQGDLYGRELELAFVEKLREELRFDSLDALKRQIARDLDAARHFKLP